MSKPWEREPRKIGIGTFKATPRIYDLIHEVLESGWISYGEKSKLFERQFAELHECKYGILSNSGTSSLHVALQAMKELYNWQDGDEVIVPASTFVATVNVVLHNNLTPVFVDIEPFTYGIDGYAVGDKIGPRTRAVIPVHLYGQPAMLTFHVRDLAEEHNLLMIEDSCESMFVTHFGESVGSIGSVGCFSLYNAHILTAGVGGIATTNREELAMKMRSLVNHGLDIEELNTDENFSPRPAVGRSFRFTHAGHSYRITELEACLALAQLEERRHIIGGRRRNANHITAGLRKLNETHEAGLVLPTTFSDNTHSWMMYPILIDNEKVMKRDLVKHLNDNLIETRDMMPITNQPIYQDLLIAPEIQYPVSHMVNSRGFYIGCHQDLEADDIEYILQVFREFKYA